MAETVPRPGMPQDEKDRLGLAAMRAAERASWAPDAALEEMSRDELLAEAGRRRVALTDTKSKPAILRAVRSVDPDAKGRTGDEAKAVADATPDQDRDAAADRDQAAEPGPGQDQAAGVGRDVAQAVPGETGREG